MLFLRGLSLTLGETYKVQWNQVMEEYQRFDCHPEELADEAKCKARGCIWEVRGDTDEVHVHIHTQFLCAITKQHEKLKFWYAFLSVHIQPSNVEQVPWCFYPKDYGYSVTAEQETISGMTVDITRNKNYRSSGRPDSPDIDTLRVEIRYHSGDMLQFKVCVLLFVASCGTYSCVSCFFFLSVFPYAPSLYFNASCLPAPHKRWHTNVPSLPRSGTRPQIAMRFRCRCRFLIHLRLTRARGFTGSLLPRIHSASRS